MSACAAADDWQGGTAWGRVSHGGLQRGKAGNFDGITELTEFGHEADEGAGLRDGAKGGTAEGFWREVKLREEHEAFPSETWERGAIAQIIESRLRLWE
jgi:hypothetical protein